MEAIDIIVPAAGVGRRLGGGLPKQYLELGGGISVIELTLATLLRVAGLNRIIVALRPGDAHFAALPVSREPRVTTVAGGAERADSVRAALSAVTTRYVMVHDAARPFVSLEDIAELLQLRERDEVGGILCSPVADTLKRGSDGLITGTVDRRRLYRAFTPQLFRTEILREALRLARERGAPVTDESSAVELLRARPRLVPGRADNFKITTPEDLALARALYRCREEP